MIFRKPNIFAFNSLISDWDKHVKAAHEGKNRDFCFSVGYMCPGYSKSKKLTSGGFEILVKPNIITSERIKISTNFAQTKDGIAWTIIREADGKKTILNKDTIYDKSLLTNEFCPSLLKERMFKVALAAVEYAKIEYRLMHL